MDNQSTPQNTHLAKEQSEGLADEMGEQMQKHKAIDAVHHAADMMLGPVAGMLVANALHVADIASEMSSQANGRTNNANAMALNETHVTLNGKTTVKPVLVLDANDDLKHPGKKLKKKPSENLVGETEKRYHERAFTQAMDLTPTIGSPLDRPGMTASSGRKRKRVTPI